LSTHPDVAPSSIKETRFFLPARYGEPLPPASEWDAYFADAGDRTVHLEATPSYFYGGAAVAEAMRARLVHPHALVVLREPVSRAISFFTYQKIRLRFPSAYLISASLATADRLSTVRHHLMCLRSTLLGHHPVLAHAPCTGRHRPVMGHCPTLMDRRPTMAQIRCTVCHRALTIHCHTRCRRTKTLASKSGMKSPTASRKPC